MIETMRWFGPSDPVTLQDIRQAGATGIVSALLDVPIGEIWNLERLQERSGTIRAAGLDWDVVESIPVHESIKLRTADAERHVGIWIDNLRAVAAAGIRTVCYNFMPVLDWTRTDLDFPLANGATALRFDYTAIAAFDLFILKREDAQRDYSDERIEKAQAYFRTLSEGQIAALTGAIVAGLPGATSQSHTLDSFARAIRPYRDITRDTLLDNLIAFQRQIVPVAEELGVNLAIHPDDPPRALFGMPRSVSLRSDFATLFAATPSARNGLTWCLGSLSAAVQDDALAIGEDHADRIHFAHLRVVEKDPEDPDNFQEAEHMAGDVSLIAAVDLLMREEARRERIGKPGQIPMRPDHGHRMAGDLTRTCNPGYGYYGRMKGLAELRGARLALAWRSPTASDAGR